MIQMRTYRCLDFFVVLIAHKVAHLPEKELLLTLCLDGVLDESLAHILGRRWASVCLRHSLSGGGTFDTPNRHHERIHALEDEDLI